MKMIIDNDGDAIMLDPNQIRMVSTVMVEEDEVSFSVGYYNTEDSNFVFEFSEFPAISKELVTANVEKIRKDIIVYLNGNSEPEMMNQTIKLAKKNTETTEVETKTEV